MLQASLSCLLDETLRWLVRCARSAAPDTRSFIYVVPKIQKVSKCVHAQRFLEAPSYFALHTQPKHSLLLICSPEFSAKKEKTQKVDNISVSKLLNFNLTS